MYHYPEGHCVDSSWSTGSYLTCGKIAIWRIIMFALWRNTRQSLKTAFRAGSRIVLFVCVCISVWRGPIPWFHRHVNLGTADAIRLAAHRTAWHAEESESEDWHLHFVLLDDILRGEGCPVPPTEEEDQSQDLFAHTMALVEHAPLSRLAWLAAFSEHIVPAVAPPLAKASPPHTNHSPPRQFLSDFAISRGLESLLCTAQC